ncbi:MAG: hypothetical protein KC635_20385 [Myxococcales bacterium]|nr:hypothetical protein [Myxococcales bacterium]MCB9733780.1 hypothetical protein [Deltaproteobacteria bacterium]
MSDAREPIVVVEATRSFIAGFAAVSAGAGAAALTVGLVSEGGLAGLGLVATAAVGLLFTLALVNVGVRLLLPRGGLLWDAAGARFGVGVTSPRDTWWVPRDRVRGIRVVPEVQNNETIERWLVLLELVEQAAVVLAASDDRSTAVLVGRRLADVAELPEVDDEAPAEVEPGDGGDERETVRIAVRRGAALQGVLAFFGTSFIMVGAGMFAIIEREPVFGFLFAPLLALLGLTFLGVVIAKRVGEETVAREGDHYSHAFRVGRFVLGARRVRARRPRWRIYVHGLRGAHLELVGEDGTLVMAGGVTARSREGLESVARLPARLGTSPRAA